MRRSTMLLATLLIASSAQAQSNAPAAAPPAACAAEPYRQFDFWIGKWDVRPAGKDVIVARSLIERLYDGCAIRENWMPVAGSGGGSPSNYDIGKKRWRQAWVDSSGTRVDFDGGYAGDAMVLTGLWRGINGPGKDGLVRMTYTRQPGGRVRQFGEVSTDGGKSWSASFDFLYSPAQ